jgi:hypothetical protein
MASTSTVQVGDRVSFKISDAFLPEPAEVLASLTVEAETNGVIVEFSDSGNSPRAYAVVQITPQQKVVLPLTALHMLNINQK